MYPLPRPAQDNQTLLATIGSDPTNQTVEDLADQLDEAQRSLATSKVFGPGDAGGQKEAALASVFDSARKILVRARK